MIKMVKVEYDWKKKKWIKLPKHSKEGFYLDGFLYDNLKLYKKMVKKNRDLGFIIVGREGDGKSVLMSTILKFLDPSYDLMRCHMKGYPFLKALIDNKTKFESLGLDESQEFNTRASMSRFNRKCIEVVSKIRAKQMYWGLALPSFFELEKYLAIHRTSFLIEVYTYKGNRGYFKFWNWEKKKLLYLKGKKNYDYSAVAPNFRGYFSYDAFPFEQEEYDKIKLKAMDEIQLDEPKSRREVKAMKQRDALLKYILLDNKLTTQVAMAKYLKEHDCPITKDYISEILSKYRDDG